MKHSDRWIIREVEPLDLWFIYSTWLKSYRYHSIMGRSVKNSVFFKEYNRVIDDILLRSKVAVACSPTNTNVIYGYAVCEGGILHYAFTKEAFWRFGIAKSLYEHLQSPKIVTHQTTMVKSIFHAHPDITYNPFLLFKQTEKESSHGESEA